MKKTFKWAALVTAICGVAGLTFVLWRDHAHARAYKAIVRGDPEVRVVRLFGRPFRMIGRPDFIAWDELARTNGGECVREFWYVPTIDLCGEEWRIGFDDRSHVVSKFHIVSP